MHNCSVNTLVLELSPHLHPQVIQDGLVLAVVSEVRPTLLQDLLDLKLQFVVGLFQVPHCLDVVGQSVIQILHGKLLIAHDIYALATGAHLDVAREAPCSRAYSHAGSQPTVGGGGDADSASTSPTVDAARTVDRPSRGTGE